MKEANKLVKYAPQFKSVILYTTIFVPLLKWLLLSHLLSASLTLQAFGVAPQIDYSHNMRILKLPKSRCQVGDLIYRLKGSDGDPNTRLVFGVSGIEGRSMIDIVPVAKSWNEADVYLRAPLNEPSYNLTVYVSDGNETTQVHSTILAMDDYDDDEAGAASSNNIADARLNGTIKSTPAANLPFLNTKHVFNVPENTEPDETIGFINVLESQTSDLPVRFELRGQGSEKFAIKYVFGPKGQSKGELVLAQRVDYERQNLYKLKVLALNAWTNSRLDTRNVAAMDLVLTVGDVQDSPPVFRQLPQWIKLFNTMRAGDLVAKVEAEDGDYADQRPVNYALDAGSPLAGYFDIDKSTGEIRLTKPIGELALHAAWDSAPMLSVFASELPDTSSYDHLWPPMYAKAELPLMLVDLANEPPQFVGGWQSFGPDGLAPGRQQSRTLHGYLLDVDELHSPEASSNQIVRWYTNASDSNNREPAGALSPVAENLSKLMGGRPFVLDLGLGSNGTFELSLEGRDAHLFRVEPSFPVTKQSMFSLTLAPGANRSLFDYDQASDESGVRPQFVVELVAQDFGSPQRQSSRIKCLIQLLDVNDNAPQFDTDLYSLTVYENAPLGQLVGSVRARDPDSAATSERVKYTRLMGQDNHLFRLKEDSGLITLDGHLDREKRSYYLFTVEARDSSGLGRANYSQVMITVLDVNDNAPVFLQSHYDAVLLADGTFHQPLVVRAIDADEPGTANSQVVYEIVAGNLNEQFSIDAVSGVIFPMGPHQAPDPQAAGPPQIPPVLKEPITPYTGAGQASTPAQPSGRPQAPDPAGKISSAGHEVEETTVPSQRYTRPSSTLGSLTDYIGSKFGWPRSASSGADDEGPAGDLAPRQNKSLSVATPDLALSYTNAVPASTAAPRTKAPGRGVAAPPVDVEQLPALDLLLSLESEQLSSYMEPAFDAQNRQQQPQSTRDTRSTTAPVYGSHDSSAPRAPPVTTLIVRAHDFGIPLRSSTVKVNIFNQALLTRSVSMILNGTSEQLEQRREAIERAFSSITGSKASIESIEALSDSSSLSVAKVRLSVPQHSLVDLTDLSGLIGALDYQQPPHQYRHPITHHYFASPTSSNITSSSSFYQDIHSSLLDANNSLERRLLIYIIIVGVCILALLAIWMIYMCCRDEEHSNNQTKLVDKSTLIQSSGRQTNTDSFRSTGNMTEAQQQPQPANSRNTYAKTTLDTPTGAIGRGPTMGSDFPKSLGNQELGNQLRLKHIGSSASHLNELLLAPVATTTATTLKDHGSMYNGQIWFEPDQRLGTGRHMALAGRRASSAPSGGSLDSALHSAIHMEARNASGQFFPNTIGYMENLAALAEAGGHMNRGQRQQQQQQGDRMMSKRNRRRKVAPLEQGDVSNSGPVVGAKQPVGARFSARGLGHDDGTFGAASGASHRSHGRQQRRKSADGSLSSCASELSGSSAADNNSVILDSDQELLGFDSTGTPIIATHTRPAAGRANPLVIEMVGPTSVAAPPRLVRPRQPGPAGGSTRVDRPPNEDVKMAPAAESPVEQTAAKSSIDGAATAKGPQVSTPSESGSSKPKAKDLMGELNEKLVQRQQSLEEQQASGNAPQASAQVSGGEPEKPEPTEEPADAPAPVAKTSGVAVTNRQAKLERRPVQSASSRSSQESSADSTATGTTVTATTATAPSITTTNSLRDMRNGELLEKQSIFTMAFSGIATDKLPSC